MTDRLDRIEAVLERLSQRDEEFDRRMAALDQRLDRMAEENTRRATETDRRFAALDTRLDRIDRQIAENSSAIGELTAQTKTNTLAIGALAESIESLQDLTRQTQNQIQQIWQRIQEILVELRNRFPGNGRG